MWLSNCSQLYNPYHFKSDHFKACVATIKLFCWQSAWKLKYNLEINSAILIFVLSLILHKLHIQEINTVVNTGATLYSLVIVNMNLLKAQGIKASDLTGHRSMFSKR